ncbi:site-specific integrase [Mesorhizobium sp. M1E.F.Ca.ET.063.01.1.1]|uniref:tyrosine-type recombinase/integrase n=1 Tax=Mesorhizobium sp. M1E.F.Ca.ET.063.01.1.1 TaxID=2496750 RepID=UPI000FCA7DEB|nr:site-specific integrase [Mesorhizobium sp. M1E.F.Ca.ET.063.01.1.1]RUW85013.1 site-specific integrase [Mesorhizobium sp. M1E.F.Ca.ET.063.01.1.1]
MPQIELTDKFCQSAKATSGRKADYFDTLVTGLVLRVSAGGTKSWYLVYGPPAKRQWLKLGCYPEIPLGGDRGARKRARDARAKVGDGGDPVADKRSVAASQTVADLVDNYVKRHASTRRSSGEIARRLRKNVSGRDADGKKLEEPSAGCIGDVKLSDLHRRDITKAIDAVKDRGAHVEANRLFEDVRAMIRWARSRGDLEQNLVEGMRKPTETAERDRVLSAEEIRTMWGALADAAMRESTRRAVRLCLVTAQRVGEVCGITVDELDLDAALWTIPPMRSKNKREHAVPLSSFAVKIIRDQLTDVKALAERKGRAMPPFVFPGPGAREPVTGAAIAKAIKREEVMKREAATILGVMPWTPHDLRRSAATHMEELGISPFIIGHVLNHVSATKASITSRVYARYDYMSEKREALDLWADRLVGIVSGGAEIVPLGSMGGA